LLASKHEEIYPPEVGDFVYICAETYSREEILATEVLVLQALDFKLCAPLSWHFLLHFHHTAQGSDAVLALSKVSVRSTLRSCFLNPSHSSNRAFAVHSRALAARARLLLLCPFHSCSGLL
jgi:hypothetical protein